MLFLLTGLHTGFVKLTVDVDEHEPGLDDSWEECVEVSFEPHAPVSLVDWNREVVCALPLRPVDYRVRYLARGMDAGRAADTIVEDEEPVDLYGVQFWPSAPARDRVIRQTSDTAKYWHGWALDL
jgi:hypothetical protein